MALLALFVSQADARAKTQPTKSTSPPEPLELPRPEPEPWSSHFTVTEITPGGHRVVLTPSKLHLVDIRSRLVVTRTSARPKTIEVRSGDREFKTHFGVKAEVRSPDKSGTRRCKTLLTVPGLNSPGTNRTGNVPDCADAPTTKNVDADIANGEEFEVDTSLLHHGDELTIRFLGDQIDERMVNSTKGCAPRDVRLAGEDGSKSRAVCPSAKLPVEGRDVAFTMLVLDYSAALPYEKRGNRWEVRSARGERFDLDNAIAVSPGPPDQQLDYPGLTSRGLLEVSAVARKGDDEPRTIACPLNARVPMCSGFKDGEHVTIIATRTLIVSGQEVSEDVARFEMEAAGIGLHYLPSGNHRAYYTTASMVAVEWDQQTPRLTFAQTIGYSLYWKHRKARWVEAFSAGAHFAVLGTSTDPSQDPGETTSTEDEPPVSLGIGGQLGIGQDALQVGGGYDVLTQRPYFVIGIGIPDAVALVQKLRK